MAAYKPGLHKDVDVIFNGVWNAKVDNIQYYITPAGLNSSGRNAPEPLISAASSENAGVTKADKPAEDSQKQDWNRWFLFSPKKRRERKRLLSISRYLNLPPK
jgi:hypothetical protein